jgi:phosphotransferase system  glucose/maltose/N-acetylglucosamine-specific IIC component
MSNTHQEKFITKLLTGFAFVTGAIMVILYASFERTHDEDWYFWGIVASLLINAGLYFLLTAFIHKVKSDFIKRQKQREQQKTFTTDSPI